MIKLEFETTEELQSFLNHGQPMRGEYEMIVKGLHEQLSSALDRGVPRNADYDTLRCTIEKDRRNARQELDNMAKHLVSLEQLDAQQLDMLGSVNARIEYLEIQMIQVIDPTGCNVCTDAECEPEPPKLRPIDLTPAQQEIAKCSAVIMQAAIEQGYFVDVDDIVVLKHETNWHAYYLVLLATAFRVPKKLRSVETESEIEFEVEFPVNSLMSSTLRSCTISTAVNRISVHTGIKSQMDNLVYLVVSHLAQDISTCDVESTSGIDNINESLALLNEVDV